MDIPIGARGGKQSVIRRIGNSRLLEDGDGLTRPAGLLQQRRKVHRHETVVFAGGQHRAQCRYGGL